MAIAANPFTTIYKKLSFLLELSTLYSYIWQRLIVNAKNFFRIPPVYPWESPVRYDARTEEIVSRIQAAIPPEQRGDNPAYKLDWDSIFTIEKLGAEISRKVSALVPSPPTRTYEKELATLHSNGVSSWKGNDFSPAQVKAVLDYLEQQKVYPAHVCWFSLTKPRSREAVKRSGSPFGSYDIETIMKAPHVANLVSNERVTALVAGYFGCLPTICNVNLYWSFTSKDHLPRGPQRFHRDLDDLKTINLFMNLTDTQWNDGAYCYMESTHGYKQLVTVFDEKLNGTLPTGLNPFNHPIRPEDMFKLPFRRGYGFDNLYMHFFEKQVRQLTGPGGCANMADGYIIHRATPPVTRDRLMLWVTYSMTSTSNCAAAVKAVKRADYRDLSESFADTANNRYVLRNIVKF